MLLARFFFCPNFRCHTMSTPPSAFRLFAHAHATHPDWAMAAALVLAQLRASLAKPAEFAVAPTLGLLYITDHYAGAAQNILDLLSAELPEVTDWSGTVGLGIAVTGAEYFDEPALAVMLCELPANSYRVFSGVSPLPTLLAQRVPGSFQAHTALVHADANTPDCTGLIAEMAQRTQSGYVFGGLTASRSSPVQFAQSGHGTIKGQGATSGVLTGGLSGVAFARGMSDERGGMGLLSRVSQGCRPLSPWRTVTACDGHVVLALDGQPALETLLQDIGVDLDVPRSALARLRSTLVGLMAAPSTTTMADAETKTKKNLSNQAVLSRPLRTGEFGGDVTVRHLIGLDPANSGIAIASVVQVGQQLAFCERNAEAARSDLIRICTEIRAALEPDEEESDLGNLAADAAHPAERQSARQIAGAVYISCAGRGGPHFGAPHAELQIIRRALGDVPLVGFFAGGEIARNQVYGYTGVLTVFTWPA